MIFENIPYSTSKLGIQVDLEHFQYFVVLEENVIKVKTNIF